MQKIINISVIVPFYFGNEYLKKLLYSIKKCEEKNRTVASFEVILVNDSPIERVYIPKEFENMNIVVLCNERNIGIQKTRINGLRYAKGEWILFLDQDDELICDGFSRQISLTNNNDVVIGNCLYQYGKFKNEIFHSYKEMCYSMQAPRFTQIRNLIPSPGECLLRKDVIPQEWIQNPLKNNGADDWLLWILLFKRDVRVGCNLELVYAHNYTNGKNLSSNLDNMKESACEMYEVLANNNCLNENEKKDLKEAIEFKYLQDTGKLQWKDIWKYRRTIIFNICYKANVVAYRTIKG